MSLQNFKKFAEGKEFRPEGPRFATTTHNSGTIYVNKRGAASTIAPPMKQHSVAKAITLSPVGRMGTPKKAPGSKDVSFFSRFRREEIHYDEDGEALRQHEYEPLHHPKLDSKNGLTVYQNPKTKHLITKSEKGWGSMNSKTKSHRWHKSALGAIYGSGHYGEETIYEMGGGGGAGGGAGGAANAGSGSQVGAPTNNASGGYIAGMGYKNPSVPGQGRVGVDMRKHKHKILTRKIGVKPKMAGKFMLP